MNSNQNLNDGTNINAKRGKDLIARGFSLHLTIPSAWTKSMNVPFV